MIRKSIFRWGKYPRDCDDILLVDDERTYELIDHMFATLSECFASRKIHVGIGIDFDEFMNIDCPNDVVAYEGTPRNPSKYMLYCDYFNDFLDYTVREGAGEKYVDFAKQLYATARKSRNYGYVFDAAAKLCDVLAIKYELGLRTRKAYEAGDKAELERLARNEYTQVIKRINVYAKAFEKQWFMDNKPHGFDVQDHRMGGLLRRADACRRRILAYVDGKLDRIEELDEALLPFGEKGESGVYGKAPWCTTVNILYQGNTDDWD